MTWTLMLYAGVTAIAATWDAATRRIPNPLLLVALLVGLTAGWITGGFSAAVGGVALGLALLWIPWTRGWVGGGDVKLVAVSGAFVGWQGVLTVLMASSVVHGASCLAFLIRNRLQQRPDQGAPFAPALALAVLVVATLHPELLTPN